MCIEKGDELLDVSRGDGILSVGAQSGGAHEVPGEEAHRL